MNLKLLLAGSILTLISSNASAKKPLKVFILAGQSNMQGKAAAYTLDAILGDPAQAKHFQHLKKDGKWTSREDVWITFLDNPGRGELKTHGPLRVGFGSEKMIRNEEGKKVPHPGIGPELGIGHILGEEFDEQILLIKAAWGGRALKYSFRPPGAMPSDKEIQAKVKAISLKRDAVIQRAKDKPNPKKKPKPIPPVRTFEEHKAGYGSDYRKIITETNTVLDNISKFFPGHDTEQGYEIAGFIWFQGWNDGVGQGNPEYVNQMTHFIQDMRKDLNTPNLPFVIGELGTDGKEAEGWIATFRKQQSDIATQKEFNGTVALAKTAQHWPKANPAMVGKWDTFRAAAKVNSDKPTDDPTRLDPGDYYKKNWEQKYRKELSFHSDKRYHYLGSAACYYRMGESMGKAMAGLLQGAN